MVLVRDATSATAWTGRRQGLDEPSSRPPAEDRRRVGAAVVVLTVAAFALHLWLSRNVGGPSVIVDEAGYLGNARWLSGTTPTYGMPKSPYYGYGYSLFLAPLHWFIDDPALLWRSVQTVNAGLLCSLVPLLFLFLRRVFAIPSRVALAAAAVGAVVPAATAAGATALSENLALPLLVAFALAAHAVATPGPLGRRVWLGPCTVLLYASHGRFTPLLVVTAVALVVGLRRGLVGRTVAVANLAILAVLTPASLVLKSILSERRWSVVTLDSGPGYLLEVLRSTSVLARASHQVIGQAWYLTIGSLGLVVVAVWALVLVLRRRPWPTDPGEPPAVPDPTPAAHWTTAIVLASALGVFVMSVLFFTKNQFRADHLIYGRHNDCFAPLWIAVALSFLLIRHRRRPAVAPLVAAGLAVAGTSVAIRLAVDPTDYGGTYAHFAIPALTRYLGEAKGFYVRASIGGLVGLGVVAVAVAVLRRPALLVVPLAAWFTWCGIGRIDDVEAFAGPNYDRWRLPEQMAELGITRVALDADETRNLAATTYQYWMPEVRFDLYEPELGQAPTGTFVLSSVDDRARRAEGARIALLDEGGFFTFRDTPEGMALWVRPGATQDRLAGEGRLLPPGYPSALPTTARRAEVALLDGAADRTITVARGGRVPVRVRGRHVGSDGPWPDAASYGLDRRVRIMARVEPLDPDGSPGALSGGELPAWVTPGETFTAEATVIAVGRYLEPLPAGRYRVTMGIGQEGLDWFAPGGEGSRFTLVVE